MFKSFWVRNALLNCLLVGLAYMSALTIATTFASRDLVPVPSADALSETRKNIDKTLKSLPPSGVDRYAFWSNLVETAFDNGHLPVASGYMLAAPQMLPKDQAAAIVAASQALSFGSSDERLLHAVDLFLPDHVRAKYDRISNPIVRNKFSGFAAEFELEPGAEPRVAPTRQNFTMLGDESDLVRKTEAWMRDARSDSLELKLVGIANIPSMKNPANLEALSILNAASKSNRLNLEFEELLRAMLNQALPDEALIQNLAGVIDEISPMRERVENVTKAYQAALVEPALRPLVQETQQFETIIANTDHNGALLLLQNAADWEDIRRLRLLAEAGGLRAVALSDYQGADVLKLADSGFRWSIGFVYNAMLLISVSLSLLLLCWHTITRGGVEKLEEVHGI